MNNQVHPTIQTSLPDNGAVFQDNSAPIHTAGSVQSWLEEHEGELQHLPWPTQSVDLNNIEPLWSVLEIRLMNRFPSLKQLEDVLQEEWYKILREKVQKSQKSVSRTAAVSKAEGGPTPCL
jgi:transposase